MISLRLFFVLAAALYLVGGFINPEQSFAQDAEDSEDAQVDFAPGAGLEVTSANGRHGFRLSGLLQLWGTGTTEDTGGIGSRPGLSASIRRGWITFGGHFYGEDNQFVFTAGYSSVSPGSLAGERFGLVDAFLNFSQLRDLEVRVGLHLSPFSSEWEQLAPNLVLPERSESANEWHLGRRLGLSLRSDDLFGLGRISYRASVFLSPLQDVDQVVSLGVVGRVNVALVGAPVLTEQGDLTRSPSPRLSIGGAYAYLQDEPTSLTLGGADTRQQATADLHFRWHGLALEGSFLWRNTADDDVATEITDFGGAAMISWMVPRINLMAVGRFSAISTRLGDDSSSLRRIGTAGLAYFFQRSHAFKLQLSISHERTEDQDPFISGILALQAQL